MLFYGGDGGRLKQQGTVMTSRHPRQSRCFDCFFLSKKNKYNFPFWGNKKYVKPTKGTFLCPLRFPKFFPRFCLEGTPDGDDKTWRGLLIIFYRRHRQHTEREEGNTGTKKKPDEVSPKVCPLGAMNFLCIAGFNGSLLLLLQ